jgi:hypothetical protein
MFGFRLLAIILGLVCLAAAASMLFYENPRMEPALEFFVRNFIPDSGVRAFIKSQDPADARVKNMIKYALGGAAILSLGSGLLFFCAAANPLRMRPFITVVMVCSALGIVCALWQGIRLEIFKSWWIGDASGALIVLVLLAALFPRKKPAAVPSEPGSEAAGD